MFPKILQNVRVLDFSRLLPGPFASDLLIKLGAKVTCILPPKGDPLLGAYSPFPKIQEGKDFLTVDLKNSAEREEVLKMVEVSQILLEGFRPGTMERMGLGFQDVSARQPKIIFASIVGFPENHPKFFQGAHDINFLVDSGVYSLLHPDNSEAIPALQLADVVGGFYAAFQILVAWVANLSNPQARHLKISILNGLHLISDYLKHESSLPLLSLLTGGLARYRIYFTKDRQRIAVAALEPKFFQNLLNALKVNYTGGEGEEELSSSISKVFQQKNLSEWKEILKDADACISFVPSREEVLKG